VRRSKQLDQLRKIIALYRLDNGQPGGAWLFVARCYDRGGPDVDTLMNELRQLLFRCFMPYQLPASGIRRAQRLADKPDVR
jgi:hypothetical protein